MDWKEMGITVASDLLPLIMIAATAAAGWGVKLIAKRFGVQLSAANEEAIASLFQRGIAAAEEAASRKLGLGESKMLGETKSKMVYDWVKAAYPDMKDSEIIMRMDAEIARMDGVGATKRAVGSSGMNDPTPVGGGSLAAVAEWDPNKPTEQGGLVDGPAPAMTREEVSAEFVKLTAEEAERVRDKSGDGPNGE